MLYKSIVCLLPLLVERDLERCELRLHVEYRTSCTSHAHQRKDGQRGERAATASRGVWRVAPGLDVVRACLRHGLLARRLGCFPNLGGASSGPFPSNVWRPAEMTSESVVA
eukprot:scaffold71971_cov69-Phaeocystis_antarctica.AAC.3